MLRNKEIRIIILLYPFLLLVATGGALLISSLAAIYVLACGVVFASVHFLFITWRYKEMAKLSSYLREIIAGDYSLDIRDNQEGELSLLKNEIYKVTMKLSNYSNSLENDKSKLTDAISDISHQLKTPLTSMTVMADLLSNSTINAKKRIEFVRNIQFQLERMDWLVSSLLKLSKIDAGTIMFKKEKINMKQLVEDALVPILIPIELKELSIEMNGIETTSFIGDKNWTKEAFINLLKNAVEHTNTKGTITIDYKENALYTELKIKDSGSGIEKKDLPYIFKRFYRGSNASESSVGIGLAMAHTIITSQRGDIEVESEFELGTTFYIKFYKEIRN
ncbi:hypothetical protein BTS2_1350 [Bacillus sp. TS-2]|nr:hypothetical protein BTS2_1350 [Bacillus sp. TS-2]